MLIQISILGTVNHVGKDTYWNKKKKKHSLAIERSTGSEWERPRWSLKQTCWLPVCVLQPLQYFTKRAPTTEERYVRALSDCIPTTHNRRRRKIKMKIIFLYIYESFVVCPMVRHISHKESKKKMTPRYREQNTACNITIFSMKKKSFKNDTYIHPFRWL